MDCCYIGNNGGPCIPGWCPMDDNTGKCTSNTTVEINYKWLSDVMDVGKELRENANVPVIINQWGVSYTSPNKTGYDYDVLTLMKEKEIHSINWEWRGYQEKGYGIAHNLSNGSSFYDQQQIEIFEKFYS